jgi:Uma2 family endonuclease
MSTQPKTRLTPEQHLEIERRAEYKSEYYNGEMFALSTGWRSHDVRRSHSVIAVHVATQLDNQLRRRPCEVYPSDMRVRVSATGLYTYPDVVVVCAPPQFLDEVTDTLLNPTLLVEVLSPSTEAYDRGRKFEHYRRIESLRQYLLVAADRVQADLFTRQPDGQWLLTSKSSLDDEMVLDSIDCRLKLADIYEKVELE